MYDIKRAKRRAQAPVHLVIDRASLFTDQRMSGLPIRAKNRHFKTICGSQRMFEHALPCRRTTQPSLRDW